MAEAEAEKEAKAEQRKKKQRDCMSALRAQKKEKRAEDHQESLAWSGAVCHAMAMPHQLPTAQAVIALTRPWADHLPVCPVEFAGLKELVDTTNKNDESNIRTLLKIFATEKPNNIKMIKEGTGKTCDLDITSNLSSQATAMDLSKKLLKLLNITEEEEKTCTQCAEMLGVNTQGVFGVYCIDNVTDIHGHMLGVLNVLLSGMKIWHLWPPGLRPSTETPAKLIITQHEGQLLWLPPGWYHRVMTSGYMYGEGIEKRGLAQSLKDISKDRKAIWVVHGFTTWCLPKELREYALCAFATGASEESQRSKHMGPPSLSALFNLLVPH